MMDSFVKQVGPKLDARHYSIITRAIDAEIGENISQIIRLALREFEKNHGLEVKKDD